MINWIGSDSSVLRHGSGDFKRLGNRIFVFMIGGATRSEVRPVLILQTEYQFPIQFFILYVYLPLHTPMNQLRTVHKLTMKMKREIVLGSSSIDDPPQFISVKTQFPFKILLFSFPSNISTGLLKSSLLCSCNDSASAEAEVDRQCQKKLVCMLRMKLILALPYPI